MRLIQRCVLYAGKYGNWNLPNFVPPVIERQLGLDRPVVHGLMYVMRGRAPVGRVCVTLIEVWELKRCASYKILSPDSEDRTSQLISRLKGEARPATYLSL